VVSNETFEQAILLAKQTELLDLISTYFSFDTIDTDDGRRKGVLRCNECNAVVTWVTRHMVERHGMGGQVWRLPGRPDSEELW
jgi:hypothetical protein